MIRLPKPWRANSFHAHRQHLRKKKMNLRIALIVAACALVLPVHDLSASPAAQAAKAAKAAAPAASVKAVVSAPVMASAEPSAAPVHPLDRADLEAWLDGMVPYALKSGDMAGAVVVVVKDGEVLLDKGYGFADISKKRRMDPEQTMVRIGSTSKLFTWTAVMQLVEQGKLDLDRDVNDYLDFTIPHDFGKPVTLRDLMNHRGGFEEGLKDILRTDAHGLPSTEAYLKEHQRPMLFAPGEVPAYSNYGASLAGYIVQRVSGEPFERYIEHHILEPLSMAHSTFDQPLPERFATAVSNGYPTASGPPSAYEQIVTRPAGSATTTAADMARFMMAHLQQGDGHILRPETLALMHSASETALPGFATMAHGFFRDTHNGRLVIGHGGDTVLFHAELDLLPDDGVGIFFSFNSRGREEAVYGARMALFDGFMDRYFPAATVTAAPTLPSASAGAQSIAGRYESSRRVEHGFLSIFYLLQQSAISANPDGTIAAPGFLEPNPVAFREVAPQIWRQVGGTRQLALKTIGGVKTVIDSEDPTSVLQAVPFKRSASLNLPVLLGSALILMFTVLAWALSPLAKARPAVPAESASEVRRLRLFLRSAAAFDVLYLAAWCMLLRPVLTLDLQVYRGDLDLVVRGLQLSGLVAIAASGLGVWSAWRLSKLRVPKRSRAWGWIIAASLLGIVWIGYIGGLLRFSVNY
jgi:CubicO group peptidase (beta-lactamase class C family)